MLLCFRADSGSKLKDRLWSVCAQVLSLFHNQLGTLSRGNLEGVWVPGVWSASTTKRFGLADVQFQLDILEPKSIKYCLSMVNEGSSGKSKAMSSS